MASTDNQPAAAAADTTTPPMESSTASLQDQNKVLFGSMSQTIADELCERIDSALEKSVASLPLMESNSSRMSDMLKRLGKPYHKRVDLLELYSNRNIFSVAMRTPKFRQRVVEAFLQQQQQKKKDHGENNNKTDSDDMDIDDEKNNKKNSKSTTTMTTTPSFTYPQKEDLPSPETHKALETELATLRQQLQQARSVRNSRRRTHEQLQAMETVTAKAKGMLENAGSIQDFQQNVQSLVAGRDALQSLQQEGQEASRRMEELKRERDENDNGQNDAVVVHTNEAVKKNRPSTLEEQYEEDRKILEGPHADLVKLKQQLRREM